MYGPELQQNTKIADRYVLREYKGSGSFGEVWLAEDVVLGIDVAIKLYITLDQKGQDEFKDEYKVAYGLSHENLLTAQHYSVWDHRPYLIMKYCSKGSAANYTGNLSEQQMWKFIHDVSNGLRYLHGQEIPIIHQDIKPENILMDDQGNFLITDFGISKKMRTTMRKQSKRTIESGAIAYMGPERFLADPVAVKASDIWSLGVSIYELATNDLPFMGQGGGMLNAGAALPILDEKKWSRNLNEIMRACLAKETWDRPTAEELAEYSQQILKGSDISFSQWKKGGVEPRPVISKKVKILAIIGAVIAVSICVVMIVVSGHRREIKQEYENLLSMFENDINIGSAENYQSLLAANDVLSDIEDYRYGPPFIINKYSYPSSLKSRLSNKLDEAQKAWIRSAKGQYEVADDIPTAIAYYNIASQLKGSSDISSSIQDMARSNGCNGAYMAVTRVLQYTKGIVIKYDGLNKTDIHDVTIRYEITGGSRGLADITIEAGRNQRVVINLDETPETGQTITLKNNGVVFYRGRID